jgi:hypothetical protein
MPEQRRMLYAVFRRRTIGGRRRTHNLHAVRGANSMDATFWMVLGLFLIVVGSSWTTDAANLRRFRSLERKLDLLLEKLGVEANAGVPPRVLELARAGEKIEAVKLYKDHTGCSLKEAKEFVESL